MDFSMASGVGRPMGVFLRTFLPLPDILLSRVPTTIFLLVCWFPCSNEAMWFCAFWDSTFSIDFVRGAANAGRQSGESVNDNLTLDLIKKA
jgi:hypothetical protein